MTNAEEVATGEEEDRQRTRTHRNCDFEDHDRNQGFLFKRESRAEIKLIERCQRWHDKEIVTLPHDRQHNDDDQRDGGPGNSRFRQCCHARRGQKDRCIAGGGRSRKANSIPFNAKLVRSFVDPQGGQMYITSEEERLL